MKTAVGAEETNTLEDECDVGGSGECARSEGEIPPSTEAFHPIGLIRHNGCPNLSGDTWPKAGEKSPGELF